MSRIIRRPELLVLVGLSFSTIHRLECAGEFPRRVRISPSGRAAGWRENEIIEWIESRKPSPQYAGAADAHEA